MTIAVKADGVPMQTADHIIITKASGEQALFSVDKLRRSLERSGAGPVLIDQVVAEVKAGLYEGISTKKIYQLAFGLLKKKSRFIAGRYNIKKGIMELGPSGLPFEKYLARILEFQGYRTEVGLLVKGHCVTHEVDVIARKGNRRCMIECKFHNNPGTISDVKVPLYIHSRFRDVEKTWLKEEPDIAAEGWVVTNTRFSSDAIQYGNCVGLKLLGWNYPFEGNLQEWIEGAGLYPLTCLTTLSGTEKKKILATGLVLSKEMSSSEAALSALGISPDRIREIVRESEKLSQS